MFDLRPFMGWYYSGGWLVMAGATIATAVALFIVVTRRWK